MTRCPATTLDHGELVHDEAHTAFYAGLSREERGGVDRILDAWSGDIDSDFLGFLGTYQRLADLIPRARVVYDIGCAYAFQAWFFRHHRGYVGIADAPGVDWRFRTDNATHYVCRVSAWARAHTPDPHHFAIHNYCPGERAVVVATFNDLFTYYPQRGDHEVRP